jgi:RimJ/RimL family protein N-acetyltransferase
MWFLTGGEPTPWNQGHATEGSRALIRKCCTDLGVDRVVAHTMAINRVMEKCGLTRAQWQASSMPQ